MFTHFLSLKDKRAHDGAIFSSDSYPAQKIT